jgi:hypothetical protein
MASSSRHGASLAIATLLLLVARGALAEPTAAEKETARAMMDEGHARRDAGDHKGALAQFQGADAIMHVPTTGVEVARELAALGLLAEARDALQRVIRTPTADDEPEAFRAARRSAEQFDDELVKRIPALRITVRGAAPGAVPQVAVDGVQVPSPALVAPFKVNPGHHVVTAAEPGATARQEVDVTDGQTAAVTVTLPEPRATEDAPNPRSASAGAGDSSPSPMVPLLRWGGFGLAIVGVGVGSFTGAMSISTTSSASKGCVNDRCPPSTWSDIDAARATATVSTIAFAAAGVGAVLGVLSFVVGGPSAPANATAAAGAAGAGPRVSPWIGPDGAGVSGAF